MTVTSEFDAKVDLKAFMADPRSRLFAEHGVREEGGWWIARECESAESARRVEQYLLKLGCEGGPGGGDETTTSVYAYLKVEHTTP